jgi:hypothetical protein
MEYAALNVARNRIESLKAVEFTSLPLTEEDEQRVNAKGIADAGGDFLRSTSVETDYDDRDDLAKVEVEVSYSIKGITVPKPVKLTTIFVTLD